MKWTPWIKFTGDKRPEGLADNRRMLVVYIAGVSGGLMGPEERLVGGHLWDAGTLAYRLEVVQETYTLYGSIGIKTFTPQYIRGEDTHKITYTVENGEVVSCVMEKL